MISERILPYTVLLLKLMKKSGTSYPTIALETGVSYQKIKDIAGGRSNSVSLDTVRKIEAYAYEVTK